MNALKRTIALAILAMAPMSSPAEESPAAAVSATEPAASVQSSPEPTAEPAKEEAASAMLDDTMAFFQQEAKVVSASRRSQSVREAPANIKVFTREQLRAAGVRKLTDVLTFLPGVQVVKHKSGGELVWVRGSVSAYNDKTLLLIDGHPFKELTYGQHPINEQIPLVDVERIELIKGPGSSLYGSNAFTGVINIITLKPQAIQKAEVSGGGGDFQTYSSGILASTKSGDMAISASGSYLNTAGDQHEYDETGAPSMTREGQKMLHAATRVSYFGLDLGVRFTDYTRTYLTRQDSRPERMPTSTTMLHLDYAYDFGDLLNLSFSSYYSDYSWLRTAERYNANGTLNRMRTADEKTQNWGGALQAEWTLPFDNLLLTAADYEVEYGFNLQRRETLTTAANPGSRIIRYSDPPNPYVPRYSLALEDTWAPGDWLHLTGGYRADFDARFETQHNFRAAAVTSLFEKVDAKLLWGTAYRAGSFRETYIKEIPAAVDDGNPNIKPERMETAEFVLGGSPLSWARVQVAAYRNVLMQFIAPGVASYANLGNFTSYGVEPELTLRGPWDSELHLNYTNRNTFDDYGNQLTGVANEMYNAGLTIKSPWLVFHYDFHHTGVRNRSAGYQSSVAAINRKDFLDPYRISNFVITSKGLPFELQIGIYNAFDARYYDPEIFEGNMDMEWAGRSLFGQIRFEI